MGALLGGGYSMLIVHEEQAQGLVEYALLLMLVFMVVLLMLILFGGQVGNTFSRITNGLATVP
jgi:pilus assembly protein Flp/PilA